MGLSSDRKSAFGLSADQIQRLLSVGSDDDACGVDGEDARSAEEIGSPEVQSLHSDVEDLRFHMEGYEIVEKVAEAGQGQVWHAIQLSTGREVAIKIPNVGSVTSERTRLRFEREIELAARLRHPNIARVYESGIDRGQHYYVMDFIHGTHLDKYVQGNGLQRQQILKLMSSVCRAVQHAHQTGVVHRDLKPSNILVTEEGHPYIIDFGLAKGLFESDQDQNVSLDGEAVGTPAYMSPEQAAGYIDRIDTRSDVYALGVILFHLLTGDSPHDLTGSCQQVLGRIANGQIRRPRAVCKQLAKEVEWLLLKALDCDPDRRYSSAQQLAEDIDNYLRGVPLLAGPPSTLYRMTKFVQRNRISVAVAAVATVVIIIGTVMSLRMYVNAKIQSQRVSAISDFLNDSVLAALNPNRDRGGEITALSILDSVSADLEDTFQDAPLLEAKVRNRVGMLYERQGEYEAATRQLQRALAIFGQKLGNDHSDTLDCTFELAQLLYRQGRLNEAEPLYLRVIDERTDRLGPTHSQILHAKLMLAGNLADMGEHREAMEICQEVLSIAQAVKGDEHKQAILAMHMIGHLNTELGNYPEAEKWRRRAARVAHRVLGPDHSWTAAFTSYLGTVCMLQGNYPEAESFLKSGYDTARRVYGDQWGTSDILADLIRLYVGWGQPETAYRLREELSALRLNRIAARGNWQSSLGKPIFLDGSASYDEETRTYAVVGSGIDIWHIFDEFHFAHKTLDGDGTIRARIDTLGSGGCWAKAGIMMRDSIEPTSKHASVFIRPGGVIEFQQRTMDRGPTRSHRSCIRDMVLPHWIKLQRQGDIFTAYHSHDGLDWKEMRDELDQPTCIQLAMGPRLHVGLAVTSADAGRVAEATISNVTTTGVVDPDGPFRISRDISLLTATTSDAGMP